MGNNEQKESGADIIFNILRDLNSEIQYISKWAALLLFLRSYLITSKAFHLYS